MHAAFLLFVLCYCSPLIPQPCAVFLTASQLVIFPYTALCACLLTYLVTPSSLQTYARISLFYLRVTNDSHIRAIDQLIHLVTLF